MSAWRQAQELTRKAEEEAMLAEKKSQEAYVWYNKPPPCGLHHDCLIPMARLLTIHAINL